MVSVEELDAVLGPCPVCGKKKWWYNDVPLRGFCWGPPPADDPMGASHAEVSIVVPVPLNPDVDPYVEKDEELTK
jgi:hypothetical protein